MVEIDSHEGELSFRSYLIELICFGRPLAKSLICSAIFRYWGMTEPTLLIISVVIQRFPVPCIISLFCDLAVDWQCSPLSHLPNEICGG